MAPVKQSNVERRRLREECREKLSRHIHSKIGIEIKPSEVRLKPNASDLYEWRVLPEKEEALSKIFSKSIGDHSIGAYRQLCEGVDVTFEAVLSAATNMNAPSSIISLQPPEISFSSKIERLHKENVALSQDLCKWRDKANAESGRGQLMERELSQLYTTNQQLQDRIRDYADTANYLTSLVTKCFQGLDKVLPMLEEVKSTVTLGVPVSQIGHAKECSS